VIPERCPYTDLDLSSMSPAQLQIHRAWMKQHARALAVDKAALRGYRRAELFASGALGVLALVGAGLLVLALLPWLLIMWFVTRGVEVVTTLAPLLGVLWLLAILTRATFGAVRAPSRLINSGVNAASGASPWGYIRNLLK